MKFTLPPTWIEPLELPEDKPMVLVATDRYRLVGVLRKPSTGIYSMIHVTLETLGPDAMGEMFWEDEAMDVERMARVLSVLAIVGSYRASGLVAPAKGMPS